MKKALFSLFILGIIVFSFGNIWADDLKVHFIDVRQGDAILIQYGGENYLIDSGKNLSSDKLIQYISSVGASTLHACLLTHPDYDHYGEFEDLIESGLFTVETFIISKTTSTNVTYIRLMNVLQNESIPIKSIDYQDDLNWTMPTDVLSPDYDNGFSSDNDNSIVIKMTLGEVDFLFTGDSVEDNNQYLLDTYNVNAEVLKVSHHGGIDGTSETFIAEVSPVVSVISSGDNGYGHPSETVINILQAAGSLIYSTADDWNTWWLTSAPGSDDGSVDDDIVLETDGEHIWVDDELVWRYFAIDDEPADMICLDFYPNPVRHSAQIQYSVLKNSSVSIDMYDIKGRWIQTLIDTPHNIGKYNIEWKTEGLCPGIYFCKLQEGQREEIKKVILLK